MSKKNSLILLSVLVILIVLIPSSSQAMYQSIPNGTRVLSTTCKNFMINSRSMEKNGMGLTEEINSNTLLSTTGNNNIDVHFQKNTEYGAALILGASNYGKPGTDTSKYMNTTTLGLATSTGNASGIYELGYINMDTSQTGYWEYTAGGISSYFSEINARYWDSYTAEVSSEKVGDATYSTRNWHGASVATWLNSNATVFVRGRDGSFSYFSGSGGAGSVTGGRACVWCGEGF